MASIKQKNNVNWLKVITIFAGLILTLGWGVFVAVSNLNTTLPCNLSPDACYKGTKMSSVIILSPLVAGSFFLSIGMIYDQKMKVLLKPLAILLSTIVIYYLIYYLTIYLTIGLHGLDGNF